jgi:uncharacterized membrane protein
MSHLIVISFDGPDDASRARDALRSLQSSGNLRIDDTAVIVRDAEGKLQVQNEIDRGMKVGLIGGGLLGMLLGFMMPIAGLAIGAAGGALVAKFAETGIDQKFVDDVSASLQAGNSALFALIGQGNAEVAIAAMEPFQGTLRHTTLPSDIEDSLRRALQ